jgi:hypothetical protein
MKPFAPTSRSQNVARYLLHLGILAYRRMDISAAPPSSSGHHSRDVLFKMFGADAALPRQRTEIT